MKFGITGSSGVLGSILLKKLEAEKIEYSCFKGDITSREDVSNWVKNNDWDGVIHLAALVPTIQVKEAPFKALDVNVSGTLNLILELQKEWIGNKKWFFYAGTSHVYKSSDKPIKETDELEPVSLYGKTKLLAENIVQSVGEIENSPFNVCIGRIFSFYHKTQKPPFLYPSIMERLSKENLNEEFFLYGADSVRDFLNAEEVIDIILKLAHKKSKGIFNIASGKPTKIRDFVQSLTDVKLNIKTNDEKTVLIADIEKLRKELGE